MISSNLIQNNKTLWHFERFTNRNTTHHYPAQYCHGETALWIPMFGTHTCFAVTIIFVAALSSCWDPSQHAPGQSGLADSMATPEVKGYGERLLLSANEVGYLGLLMSLSPAGPLSPLHGKQGAAAIWKNRLTPMPSVPGMEGSEPKGDWSWEQITKATELQSVPWRSTLLCLTSSHANIPRSAGLEIWWIVKGLKIADGYSDCDAEDKQVSCGKVETPLCICCTKHLSLYCYVFYVAYTLLTCLCMLSMFQTMTQERQLEFITLVLEYILYKNKYSVCVFGFVPDICMWLANDKLKQFWFIDFLTGDSHKNMFLITFHLKTKRKKNKKTYFCFKKIKYLSTNIFLFVCFCINDNISWQLSTYSSQIFIIVICMNVLSTLFYF